VCVNIINYVSRGKGQLTAAVERIKPLTYISYNQVRTLPINDDLHASNKYHLTKGPLQFKEFKESLVEEQECSQFQNMSLDHTLFSTLSWE
jgi:hypothetical protein